MSPADAADAVRRIGDRALARWLVVAGAVGLLAAATLLVEKVAVLKDPSHAPSCDLSPILSCGSIMSTPQAEAFGFPNPLLGVAAFPIVLTTGVALIAGARLARWYWLGLQGGVLLGLAFVCWLVAQSLYDIGALCPYCMVVWAVVLPTAWYVTLRNLDAGAFGDRARRSRLASTLLAWHAPVLLAAFLVVIALIGARFASYWASLV